LLKQLKREPVLASLTLESVAELIKAGRVRRIITMCGAGISVSAGIPDFRTPGTGLYSQVGHRGALQDNKNSNTCSTPQLHRGIEPQRD
jgi:NAD-dependent SIR2 family protein deacetylase